LVVFGYYEDQAKGANFNKHIERLRDALDDGNRLLLKGSERDFAVGISKTSNGKSLNPSRLQSDEDGSGARAGCRSALKS
jgi:hypothetical protein